MTIRVFKLTKWGVLKLTFDLEGFTLYQEVTWSIQKRRNVYYLVHQYGHAPGQWGVRFHRKLLNIPTADKRQVDHINHDGLDNRTQNLRLCSNAENCRNQRKKNVPCSSKHKGVHWIPRLKKWRALIHFNGKGISLGCFLLESEAASAYNAKAIELYGEFAYLNVIP